MDALSMTTLPMDQTPEQLERQKRQSQRVRSMLVFMLVLAGIMFGLTLFHP
jgi:predicted nucleic acid-binding Zn ribbon protein